MLGTLSSTEIEAILKRAVIGRIGYRDGERVWVVPITYAYDGTSVIAHSREGHKTRAMRASPSVCFEVEEIDDLAAWRSVVAQGRFEVLSGDEAIAAMAAFVARMRPLMTSETARPTHGSGGSADAGSEPPVLYRIVLTEKTGRFERR
jgi:nitroimidazol reductase NimA-like FMN-containing flavoprotein (pyridoxamine 5'-phosphate oxidase superfamily)